MSISYTFDISQIPTQDFSNLCTQLTMTLNDISAQYTPATAYTIYYNFGQDMCRVRYFYLIFDGDVAADIVSATASGNYSRWSGTEYVPWGTFDPSGNYTIYYDNTNNVTVVRINTNPYMQREADATLPCITVNGLDILYMGNDNDVCAAARAFFDTPSVPFLDIDVYTEPPIVTTQWGNIDNIPAGMYPASYYLRFKVRDINGTYPPYKVSLCPYTMHEYSTDWRDMVNNMPAEPRDQVYADGAFNLKIELGYIDENVSGPDKLNVVNDCVFRIDISDGTVTVEDAGQGNTATPHTDTSPLSDQSFDDDTGSTEDEDVGLALSVDNLLTSSFKLTETDLNAIGADLWQNNWQATLYENQVSPIENIISCKRLPFDVAASATSTHVYLGNHDTGVSAYRTAETSHSFDAGTITVPVYCNNFLDFTSNISIYLPYCGIHSIPTSLCYHQTLDSNGLPKLAGNELKVMYYYDILYGTCAAVLSVRKDNTQKWATFAVFNGTCGVDIPISQSSRASVQLAMDKAGDNMALGVTCTLANAGLGAGAQLATGNYLGAALTAGHAAINAAQQKASYDIEKSHQQLHYTTSGGFSSQIASYLPASVVLLIEHARYNEPTTYKHENGYPCNLSLVLGNLEGYSELDGSIEISGINCLEEERALLKQAFCEGFYMQPDPDPSLP